MSDPCNEMGLGGDLTQRNPYHNSTSALLRRSQIAMGKFAPDSWKGTCLFFIPWFHNSLVCLWSSSILVKWLACVKIVQVQCYCTWFSIWIEFWMALKKCLTPKWKFSSFTHPHVIPNLIAQNNTFWEMSHCFLSIQWVNSVLLKPHHSSKYLLLCSIK